MTNSNGNSIEQQIAEIHARIDGLDRDYPVPRQSVSRNNGAVCSKCLSRSRNHTGNASRHPRYPDGKPTDFTPFI